ncbi:unnamed protein product [Phytomonas sp. Hart1]|nr:unnamed protein product [Phytomonas sp. Hart1]|eukprot:CCW69859.1 unnamed protein product [Phytomonas sp. isolate Hart1]
MEGIDILSSLEVVDDSVVPTHSQLKSLDEVATVALTSAVKVNRDAAARQLRYLSTYEHWNTTKALLTAATEYRYLHFMVCKAALFLVSNEIGPDERREVQYIVLNYLKVLRENSEALRHYVQHELYAILASATYLNWKLDVLSAEQEDQDSTTTAANGTEGGGPTPVGRSQIATILGFFQGYLTPEEFMDCLLELIPYFSQQCIKIPIFSTRMSFVAFALPFFFEQAGHLLDVVSSKAAQVCCVVLECLFENGAVSEATPITIRHYRENSIHLSRWEEWANSLPVVLQYSKNMLIHYPTNEDALLHGRLLRLCSTLTCSEESYTLSVRPAITQEMILLSSELLKVCQGNNALMEHLHLACDILINTFERDEQGVSAYLVQNIDLISAWADATQYVLTRFSDEEDELRQSLMHLFYLFADNLLPPPPRGNQHNFDDFLEHACIIHPCEIENNGPNASPPLAPVDSSMTLETDKINLLSNEQTNSEGNQYLKDLVFSIFTTYSNSVINKAHLKEDSQELRMEVGMVLHNEKTLLPLASMLFCKRINFLDFLVDQLRQGIEDYHTLVSIREARWWNSEIGINTGDAVSQPSASNIPTREEQALMLLVERFPDVKAVVSGSAPYLTHSYESNSSAPREGLDILKGFPSRDAVEMLLMRVILSHLSVIISIFAIAMANDTAPGDNSVLEPVAKFARQLLTGDDKLVNNLLQCLSIFGTDATGNPTTFSNDTAGNHNHAQVHFGILRALFFFCNCLCESYFHRRPEFFDISLDLLRFVYLYHSDIASLVTDANLLLRRILTSGTGGSVFLGSDKLLAVVRAIAQDGIPSFRAVHKLDPAMPLLPREVRSGFYTAFMALVEAREQAGFHVEDVVSKLITQMISPEGLLHNPAQTFIDLTALSRGVKRPTTLLVILERVLDYKEALMQVMNKDLNCATLVVCWLTALCTLAQHLLENGPIGEMHCSLSSFVMRMLNHFFDLVSFSATLAHRANLNKICSPNVEDSAIQFNSMMLFDFDSDRVEATVVYDLSDFLYCMCCAPWSNLGIMHYYERHTVEMFFTGSVQFFTFLPVDMLMSSERGRNRVFSAMLAALTTDGTVFQQLHQIFIWQNMWDRILRYLTKCLAYFYLPVILKLMFIIVNKETVGGGDGDGSLSGGDDSGGDSVAKSLSFSNCLPERTLGFVLREIVILVAVSPYLEKNECAHAFFLIEKCFRRAPALCTDHFVRLLDVCSAYHRVRIRHIMNNVREGHDFSTLLNLYLRCFGQSSKVSTLAAW